MLELNKENFESEVLEAESTYAWCSQIGGNIWR